MEKIRLLIFISLYTISVCGINIFSVQYNSNNDATDNSFEETHYLLAYDDSEEEGINEDTESNTEEYGAYEFEDSAPPSRDDLNSQEDEPSKDTDESSSQDEEPSYPDDGYNDGGY